MLPVARWATPTQRAVCPGCFIFFCEAPVARWHLPSVLPCVTLPFLVTLDATREQVHIAQKQRRRHVRVSAPLYVRGWLETTQRPAPTRKSGNAQLLEAPSCFEAEVMEEDRAHSGLQTHGHVGFGARACQGTPTPTQSAACSGCFLL